MCLCGGFEIAGIVLVGAAAGKAVKKWMVKPEHQECQNGESEEEKPQKEREHEAGPSDG